MMKATRRLVNFLFGFIGSAVFLSGASAQNAMPAPSGLVAWWKGEGNTLDAVGANSGVTNVGLSFTPGEVGTAFQFDGINSKIELGDPEDLQFTNSFSIESWIWIKDLPSPSQQLGHILFRGDTRYALDPYYFSVMADGGLRFHIEDDLGTVPGGVNLDAGVVTPQKWVHVAAVFDADAASMVVYLDGVPVGQTNTIVRPFRVLSGGGVALGNHSQGYDAQAFNGLVDELSVYNRALDASEVAAIYAAGSQGKSSSPGPVITEQPANAEVFLGGTVAFRVRADSTLPLTFQWRHDGATIPLATNSTLNLTGARLSQGGDYSVTVSDANGSVDSSNAFLKVLLPPVSGLVAYYPFTGSAYDASGNGNDGTVVGATLSSDRFGVPHAAYSFAGTATPESTIKVETTPFGLAPDFTFAAWVNFAGGIDNPRIFSTAGWEIGTVGAGASRRINFNNLTATQLYNVVSSNSYAAGAWHHVVAVRTTNAMMLYVDGLLQGAGNASGDLDYTRPFIPEIGGNSGSLRDAFGGKLDDVCIFSRALSADEIEVFYNSTNAVDFLNPKINHAPIADAGASEKLVVSPNGMNALVVLDASLSSDADADPLTCSWFQTGGSNALANGVVTVQTLPLGTNLLTLVVSDGLAVGTQDFTNEVITTSEAVDRLADLVRSRSVKLQPLIASLNAALASIDRSQPAVAINQLQAFQQKVQVMLTSFDSVLAAQLITNAQAVIDALNEGISAPVPTAEITSLTRGEGGRAHLKIRGSAGRTYVVETSTDLVNWQTAGIAIQCGDAAFEFDDPQSPTIGARYYRIASPK